MEKIPKEQVIQRLRTENPWWTHSPARNREVRKYKRRAYFKLFWPLLADRTVKRALLLMGRSR